MSHINRRVLDVQRIGLLIGVVLAVVPLRMAKAQDSEWMSNGPSSAYTDAANWDTNSVPTGPDTNAHIRQGATGGNQATIQSGDNVSPQNVFVYTETGDGGVLNVQGGSLNIGTDLNVFTDTEGCCWLPDDRDTDSTMNQSGGDVTVGNQFWLGRDNKPGLQSIYNLSGGTLEVGHFFSGDATPGEPAETGSAVMNVTGGTMTVRHDTGSGSTIAGQFNISGTGQVEFSDLQGLQVGGSQIGDGLLHVSDNGSLTIGGLLSLANQQVNGDHNDAEFRMEGGTATLADVRLGSWQGPGLDAELGREEAFFNLSGGSVTAANMDVGSYYNSYGELNVSGGTLQVTGALRVAAPDPEGLIGFETNAIGVFNLSATGSVRSGSMIVGADSPGTVNQSSGTLKVDTTLTLGELPEGQGTYNLTGGVLDMSNGDIVFGDGDGVFNFDGGTLRGAANIGFSLVNNGGTLAPGESPGTTSVAGDYLVVSSEAALEIELGGTADGQFDRLVASGQVLLDGSLNVLLIDGFNPVNGDSFDILDFATIGGSFAVNLPPLSAGLSWDQSGLMTNGILAVIGGVVVGDFNDNGVLDAADINDLTGQSASGLNNVTYDLNADTLVNSDDVDVWVTDLFNSWIGDANLDREFNSSDLVDVLASGTYEVDVASVWTTGDFNGDGRTTSSDLVAALADGGYELGPKAAVAASVPEPTSMFAWTVFSLLTVCLARRRRSA